MRIDFERIKEFHGHVGPYVVIGWRMGARAMAELGAGKYFGASVQVTCADRPPESCLIDGLQFSTGCTMGKRNITHTVGTPVEVTVTAKESGRSITIHPRDEVIQQAIAILKADGEDAAVAWVDSLGDGEMMEIRV